MIGATSGGGLPLHWSKLTKRACVQAELAQNFQPSNGLISRRHFEALAGNLAGKVGRRGVDRDEDVALDDIVERHGPLRPAVPELLLCAGFVETRAGQLQLAWRN